jgi:hypothetical protein
MTRRSPSPEARFVTLCVREPALADAAAVNAAAAAVRDWAAVVAVAERHRATAYVRQALARTGVTIPQAAEQALSRAAFAALAQAMALEGILPPALDALAAAGVPVLVLKGPVLARTIYAERALRPYADVDLCVPAEHEAAAAAALVACGFQEISYEAEAARQAHAAHVHVDDSAAYHRMFVSSDGRSLLELHADPLQLGVRPTCEAARWQRALPVPGLPGALMLCPEDQLVQLSVHAHKHGFDRLIWLKDLDLLLRTYGLRFDWDLVVAVARQEGVCASVWYSLELATSLLGTPVPDPVRRRLRPGLVVRALYAAVWPQARIAALQGFMRRRAVQFHAAESWRGLLPSLILMGRRRERARATVQALLGG